MNNYLLAIILSALPISELRGGIPVMYGSGENITIFFAFFACVAVNIAVIPFLFLFLDLFNKWLLKIPVYNKLFHHFVEKARVRTEKKIKKYSYFGLFLFTAVPLPVTGAYTATLASWFFNMNKLKSFIAIALGVVTAGVIISLVVLFGSETLKFLFTKSFH